MSIKRDAKQMKKGEAIAPSPMPAHVPTPGVKPDLGRLLGNVSWLMMRSPPHRHLFIADLEWAVLPPLALGQAKLYQNQNEDPVAFVSWALVSDEVNERLQGGMGKLKPDEWRSGTHPWIMEIVAPFGPQNEALNMTLKSIFGSRAVPVFPLGGKMMRAPDEHGTEVGKAGLQVNFSMGNSR